MYDYGWFDVWVLQASGDAVRAITSPDYVPEYNLAGFPTAAGTLPLNYYNLKLADPQNVFFQGAVSSLPCYTGSVNFVQAIYQYFISQNLITDGLRVADLVDVRTGVIVGSIGVYGKPDRLNLVAATSPQHSDHFRIQTDYQYLGLASPRLDTILPYISPNNLISTEPSIASQLTTLRAMLLKTEITPNAAAAALIGGGLLSGLGQGLGAYGQATLHQKYVQANMGAVFQQQKDVLKQVFGNNWELAEQQYGFNKALQDNELKNRLEMRGLFAYAKVPGTLAQNQPRS